MLDEVVDGPGEARIGNRSYKQHDLLLLFGCLYELGAEPTNNRAKRSFGPAVIARKISCGNKTCRSHHIGLVLAILAPTCRQRGEKPIDYLIGSISLAAPTGCRLTRQVLGRRFS